MASFVLLSLNEQNHINAPSNREIHHSSDDFLINRHSYDDEVIHRNHWSTDTVDNFLKTYLKSHKSANEEECHFKKNSKIYNSENDSYGNTNYINTKHSNNYNENSIQIEQEILFSIIINYKTEVIELNTSCNLEMNEIKLSEKEVILNSSDIIIELASSFCDEAFDKIKYNNNNKSNNNTNINKDNTDFIYTNNINDLYYIIENEESNYDSSNYNYSESSLNESYYFISSEE